MPSLGNMCWTRPNVRPSLWSGLLEMLVSPQIVGKSRVLSFGWLLPIFFLGPTWGWLGAKRSPFPKYVRAMMSHLYFPEVRRCFVYFRCMLPAPESRVAFFSCPAVRLQVWYHSHHLLCTAVIPDFNFFSTKPQFLPMGVKVCQECSPSWDLSGTPATSHFSLLLFFLSISQAENWLSSSTAVQSAHWRSTYYNPYVSFSWIS